MTLNQVLKLSDLLRDQGLLLLLPRSPLMVPLQIVEKYQEAFRSVDSMLETFLVNKSSRILIGKPGELEKSNLLQKLPLWVFLPICISGLNSGL